MFASLSFRCKYGMKHWKPTQSQQVHDATHTHTRTIRVGEVARDLGVIIDSVAEIGLLPRLRWVAAKSFNLTPLAFVPP